MAWSLNPCLAITAVEVEFVQLAVEVARLFSKGGKMALLYRMYSHVTTAMVPVGVRYVMDRACFKKLSASTIEHTLNWRTLI